MTGGKVVVLGKTGRNFAAGMSGGIAYVYDPDKKFINGLCNTDTIEFETMEADELNELKNLITSHFKYTSSIKASIILEDWDKTNKHFVKVMPVEYKKALKRLETEKQIVEEITL